MQKPHELDSHHDIELAWWIEPTAVQFRIIGKAYTFSADQSETTKALKAMGITGEDGEAGWWEKKRKEVWEKEMSGHLRGSFARPQPGKPLSEIKEKPEDWPTRLDADSVSIRWPCYSYLITPIVPLLPFPLSSRTRRQ